jgi:hypothetical protein
MTVVLSSERLNLFGYQMDISVARGNLLALEWANSKLHRTNFGIIQFESIIAYHKPYQYSNQENFDSQHFGFDGQI